MCDLLPNNQVPMQPRVSKDMKLPEFPAGTCLVAYRGSMAHGMYIPSSDPKSIDDIDLMGVVIGSRENYLGLKEWGGRGTLEIWEEPWDCVYYELRKIITLLLQGNPNVLSILWVEPEHILFSDEAGNELRRNRELFVGRHVYRAFAGYAWGQLKKMETRDPTQLREYIATTVELKARGAHPNHRGDVIPYPSDHDVTRGEGANAKATSTDVLWAKLRSFQKKGENVGYLGDKRKKLVLEKGYDSKNAAHCIRLLRMCKEFLATGVLLVNRPDSSELLEIKRGLWSLESV